MNSLDRSRRRLAAGLAALAGYVDATGFLSADRYFVSFMSGNTTRLATEIVADPPRAILPALLIGGFILGVTAGSVTAQRTGRWRKPAVLALVTLLLAAASCAALVPWSGHVAVMMGCMVLAMGALNTAVHNGETPVALTYLTGAVVRMGLALADRLTGREGPPVAPFLALWGALAGGAVLGALVFTHVGFSGLVPGCAASAVLTLAGTRIARRPAFSPGS